MGFTVFKLFIAIFLASQVSANIQLGCTGGAVPAVNNLCPTGETLISNNMCCPDANVYIIGATTITTLGTTATTPAPSDTCQDTLNPNTGVNDCPGLKDYCSVPAYVTMMKERCPLTCGYCVCTGTTYPPVAGLCPAGMILVNNSCCPNANVHNAGACADKINPQTGVDDCPGMIAYCNNPIYHDIMKDQCPKTCGFC